jgi:hypothetical protein
VQVRGLGCIHDEEPVLLPFNVAWFCCECGHGGEALGGLSHSHPGRLFRAGKRAAAAARGKRGGTSSADACGAKSAGLARATDDDSTTHTAWPVLMPRRRPACDVVNLKQDRVRGQRARGGGCCGWEKVMKRCLECGGEVARCGVVRVICDFGRLFAWPQECVSNLPPAQRNFRKCPNALVKSGKSVQNCSSVAVQCFAACTSVQFPRLCYGQAKADECKVAWLFARVTAQFSDRSKFSAHRSQQKAPTTLLLYWFSLLPHLPANTNRCT